MRRSDLAGRHLRHSGYGFSSTSRSDRRFKPSPRPTTGTTWRRASWSKCCEVAASSRFRELRSSTRDAIIRPLLSLVSGRASSWVEEQRNPWREDSSNLDTDTPSQSVRHRLLPVLEEASPSLRTISSHLAEAMARDDSYLSEELASRESWIDPWDSGRRCADICRRRLPPPLRTRWLHAQARQVGCAG